MNPRITDDIGGSFGGSEDQDGPEDLVECPRWLWWGGCALLALIVIVDLVQLFGP